MPGAGECARLAEEFTLADVEEGQETKEKEMGEKGKLVVTSDSSFRDKPESERRDEFDREYVEGTKGNDPVYVRDFRHSDLVESRGGMSLLANESNN